VKRKKKRELGKKRETTLGTNKSAVWCREDFFETKKKKKKKTQFNLISLVEGATGFSIHSCGFVMLQSAHSHNSSQLRAADLRTRASGLEPAVSMKDELR